MLVVSKQQMMAFESAAFELWLCSHLRDQFPAVFDSVAPGEIEAWVCKGLQAAGAYGLSSQAQVARFIDVMVIAGEEFDTRLEWAAEILKSDAPADWSSQGSHEPVRSELP